jgi:hypothetical protein
VLQGIAQGMVGSLLFVLDKREIATIRNYSGQWSGGEGRGG